MFHLVNALWEHPSPSTVKNRQIAFTLGIAWHEKFVSETPASKFISFPSDDEIINAYNRGSILSFLSEKQTINLFIQKQRIHPVPILKQTLSSVPLYHYLDKKYAKFMADFSEELRLHQPFTQLE